jgi:hypothetical protein
MTALIKTFRKKPVEIQAIQFDGTNDDEIRAFAPSMFELIDEQDRSDDPEIVAQVWDRLHSTWVGVKSGQWIIRGVQGEFYPVAEDVFAGTYDEVPG